MRHDLGTVAREKGETELFLCWLVFSEGDESRRVEES